MENTARSAGYLAISGTSAGGCELRGPWQRHALSAAAELGQRNGQMARKRVYIEDTPATAAATFIGMSGLRAWSPPV